MESKREKCVREIEAEFELLIEPVWNRNPYMRHTVGLLLRPFNRTSMESKQDPELLEIAKQLTFNRTSMESKRVCP